MSQPHPRPSRALRLRVWIDATRPEAALRVFGMSLLERVLRGLLAAGVEPEEVRIELPESGARPPLRPDVARRLPLRFASGAEAPAERLARATREAEGAALLAFDGDAIVDARLVAHLSERSEAVAARGEGEGGWGAPAAALRLHGALPPLAPPVAPAGPAPRSPLRALADAAVAAGALKDLGAGEIDDYLPRQRRNLPPYLFGLHDAASVAPAERFLFWSTYKGSTDFFTRYVYPPLVWLALKPTTRVRLHPNWITGFNVLITLGAVPLFAQGRWIAGLLCAWSMSVLDSVDGKLARLTFRSSELGHNLDHGLDLIHPPLWYGAWAWALGGGNASSVLFQGAIWMTVAYVLDRLVIRLFTWRTARSIHAFTPLDVAMRTWISRRNINLPIFTVALPLGLAVPAFWLIVAWQLATLVFHAVRLAQCWSARAASRPAADAA